MSPVEVVEAGEFALEVQFDGADRAVALFGDDDLGHIAGVFQALFPLFLFLHEVLVGFALVLRRLVPFQVVFLAENEHHHIGVLFDGAGLPEVGQLRAFVVALLDGARQLRQGQYRHFQFLGQGLQATGDFRDLLDPPVIARRARRGDQLQVIDDDQAEALLAFEPPGAGAQGADGQRRGIVDIHGNLVQGLAGRNQPVEIGVAQFAFAHFVRRNIGLFGDNTRRQLFGGHFERKETDDGALGAARLMMGIGRVIGHVGGQGGFPHGRPPGQNQQVGRVQSAQYLVDILEAGTDTGQAAIPLVGLFGHFDGGEHGILEGLEAAFVFALGGQVIESLFGVFDLLGGALVDLAAIGLVDHVLTQLDEFPFQVEVVNQPSVFPGIDDGNGGRRQFRQIGWTADVGQAFVLFEITFQGNRVGDLAALDQLAAGFVKAPVLAQGEMFGPEEFGNPFVYPVVGEHRAEQGLFRLDIVRQGAERRLGAGLPMFRLCGVGGCWGANGRCHGKRLRENASNSRL